MPRSRPRCRVHRSWQPGVCSGDDDSGRCDEQGEFSLIINRVPIETFKKEKGKKKEGKYVRYTTIRSEVHQNEKWRIDIVNSHGTVS